MGCAQSSHAASDVSAPRGLDALNRYKDTHYPNSNIHKLSNGLISVIENFNDQNYEAAYELLTDVTFLGDIGYRLKCKYIFFDPETPIDEAVAPVTTAMSYNTSSKQVIDLTDVIIKNGADVVDVRTAGNDPLLAVRVLPIFIEEYIHILQHLIGGHLSPDTTAFKRSNKFKKEDDLDEVDICAFYRDLGWNQIVTCFYPRYPERLRFLEFVEERVCVGSALVPAIVF